MVALDWIADYQNSRVVNRQFRFIFYHLFMGKAASCFQFKFSSFKLCKFLFKIISLELVFIFTRSLINILELRQMALILVFLGWKRHLIANEFFCVLGLLRKGRLELLIASWTWLLVGKRSWAIKSRGFNLHLIVFAIVSAGKVVRWRWKHITYSIRRVTNNVSSRVVVCWIVLDEAF